jgi:hypothetical protein
MFCKLVCSHKIFNNRAVHYKQTERQNSLTNECSVISISICWEVTWWRENVFQTQNYKFLYSTQIQRVWKYATNSGTILFNNMLQSKQISTATISHKTLTNAHICCYNNFINTVTLGHVSDLKGQSSGSATPTFQQKGQHNELPDVTIWKSNKVKHIQGVPGGMCQTSGWVFLMLKYTDITQNTYVQRWMVMEIMAREKCGLLWGSTHCTCQLTVLSISVLVCGVILRLTLALNCIPSGW